MGATTRLGAAMVLTLAATPRTSAAMVPSADAFEHLRIEVGDLTFDALAAGPADGELVLLLHGFPETSWAFRHQIPALAAAGFRAVAPDQRGYSADARPRETSAYGMGALVGDALGIASALGHERFHLVGHDWGGAVAWVAASAAPDRVISLTVFSTPHVTALGRAIADPGSEQARASSYFGDFSEEGSERLFLADDAARLRSAWKRADLDARAEAAYLDVLGNEDALRAALNWYRASAPRPGRGTPAAAGGSAGTRVPEPTLYVWSTDDPAFTRAAAEATRDYVDGPYHYEVLEGVSHWIPEEAAERATELLLSHLERWRLSGSRAP